LECSWWRWSAATALVGVLTAWEFATIATDLPGYMYVAPLYAMLTLALLLAGGLVALVYKGIRHLTAHSSAAA
jgi:hypothetical protein